VERLGATEAHARQVAGGAMLRPLSVRHLSGASVVAGSGVAAAVCDKRPASGSGRRAPKWQAQGSVLRGGGQGVRVRRCAGAEDQSGRVRPEAGVVARVTIAPMSCGAGAGKLGERGRV
jgi:hypothetical protein